MINLDEQSVTNFLKGLIADLEKLDRVKIIPSKMVLLNTGNCGNGGNYINYRKNTGVGELHSKEHYLYDLYDLIDKDKCVSIINESIANVNNHNGIKTNLEVEFITATSTYTCSSNEVLHIYTIGGGGGFAYNDFAKENYGIGDFGDIDYNAYSATAGETFDITIGAGGDNQTDSVTASDGTATTIASNDTSFFLTASGGAKGVYGTHNYTQRLTRHWYNANFGVTRYIYSSAWYNNGNNTYAGYKWASGSEYNNNGAYYPVYDRLTTHIDSDRYRLSTNLLEAMPPYGRWGRSQIMENEVVVSDLPASSGCVIIIKELIC